MSTYRITVSSGELSIHYTSGDDSFIINRDNWEQMSITGLSDEALIELKSLITEILELKNKRDY